jgi:hypothetical protein
MPECDVEFPSYDLEEILKEGATVCITVTVDAGRQQTYVNGELKDVKVFGEALSKEEVQECWFHGQGMNRGHVPSIEEVFADWNEEAWNEIEKAAFLA